MHWRNRRGKEYHINWSGTQGSQSTKTMYRKTFIDKKETYFLEAWGVLFS